MLQMTLGFLKGLQVWQQIKFLRGYNSGVIKASLRRLIQLA